jgi:uncharacterized protein VirK/YbjX
MPFVKFPSGLVMILGTLWAALRVAEIPGRGLGEWRKSVRRARKGAALFADLKTHLQVALALGRREVRPVVRASPLMMFKYLTDYLKSDLSRKERAAILVHHYTFLGSLLHERFFREISDGRLELWRDTIGDNTYSILLTFPQKTDAEGDLALIFRANQTDLYTLCFTFGPGSVARLPAANVMYIARVQGKGGALDRIRLATKDCLDISPPALLLAAAEGIATELSLDHMIGIGGKAQISAGNSVSSSGLAAYDEFWTALGGERLAGDMYLLGVPLVEKPITAIQRSHRSRVRRKRAYKALVASRVRTQFREFYVPHEAEVSESESRIASQLSL